MAEIEIFDEEGDIIPYSKYIYNARKLYFDEVFRYVEVSDLDENMIAELAMVVGVSVKAFKQLTHDIPKMAGYRRANRAKGRRKRSYYISSVSLKRKRRKKQNEQKN